MTLHDHIFVRCHFVYMNMNGNYGCAILAGGAGSRMGHVNKANLEYRGLTFAESIMEEMSRAGLPCYMSVASFDQSIPEGWTPVRDTVTDPHGGFIGPVGGIYSCLLRARNDGLDGLFFAPCDAPLYRYEAIMKLSVYTGGNADAVLWKTPDEKIQTTFGWYSVRCLDAMKEDIAEAKYKILKTLSKVRHRIVDTEQEELGEDIFSNINRAEDYLEILSREETAYE